ncbi:unnamed protein product [Symbiodinium natans]|uniref:Tyrosinase copper-binding domain-containing protein n=1 Tax=Symbiodinium natans TaxID=878477 RepID=A0A812V5M0_9DINO|nr:unnamed protein product [Symbiodinium natans]
MERLVVMVPVQAPSLPTVPTGSYERCDPALGAWRVWERAGLGDQPAEAVKAFRFREPALWAYWTLEVCGTRTCYTSLCHKDQAGEEGHAEVAILMLLFLTRHLQTTLTPRRQRLPVSESEAEERELGRPMCRKALAGAGVLALLGLCVVALQRSPDILSKHLGSPSVVEGELEPMRAFPLGRRWRQHQKWLRTGFRDAAASAEQKDVREQEEAKATWEVINGQQLKFQNKPRVRREWRTLSEEMKQKVAKAFWTVKTLSEEEGQRKYGPNFHNHDDMLMLHSCATTDPRCDEGHFGPQFMTFHRALLLKYELALLAVDPSIEAMPYWNMAYDAVGGKYRNDPAKYIFTNNFFGSYYGAPPNHAVVDGLFANWPVAHWTSERFGNKSHLAAGNPCITKEYFRGTKASTCDRCCGVAACECGEDDKHTTFLRAHDDCTPVVARWPEDPDALGPLGGTYEIVYTEEDFDNCTDLSQVRTWMEWQDCIEMSTFMCSQRFERISVQPGFLEVFRKLILPEMETRADALKQDDYGTGVRKAVRELAAAAEEESTKSDAFTQVLQEIMKTMCGDYMLYGFVRERLHLGKKTSPIYPHFFHSQAHIKFGKDLLDVTTSPNEAAAFTGYHSDIDRSSMTWMLKAQAANPDMESASWLYPPNQAVNPFDVKGKSEGIGKGISGPFAIYDVLGCAKDRETYSEYRVGESPWLPGTLLNEVVNSGFAFKNLFTCDASCRCDGGKNGYTHYDILYWTAPQRTPYTYDTLEHYYY